MLKFDNSKEAVILLIPYILQSLVPKPISPVITPLFSLKTPHLLLIRVTLHDWVVRVDSRKGGHVKLLRLNVLLLHLEGQNTLDLLLRPIIRIGWLNSKAIRRRDSNRHMLYCGLASLIRVWCSLVLHLTIAVS